MRKLSLEQEAEAIAEAPGSVWSKRKVLRLWARLSHKERGQLDARLKAIKDEQQKAEGQHHAQLIKAVKENLQFYPDAKAAQPSTRGSSGRKSKPGRARAFKAVTVQRVPSSTNPTT